jgi:kynurenine formamidase
MKLYDLSHPFSAADMVFPGTPPMEYNLSHTTEKDNYNLGLAAVNTHAGTHTDAPRHFLANGCTLEAIPLASYVGPCVVVDVRHRGAKDDITVQDIQSCEDLIREKKRILFLTGWCEKVNTFEYFTDYPRISLELAEWLVQLGVVMVGVEPPSLNPPLYIEVHQVLLKNNVAIIEGLRGLDAILGKDVIFCGAPLAFAGADGFPVRAYAIEV